MTVHNKRDSSAGANPAPSIADGTRSTSPIPPLEPAAPDTPLQPSFAQQRLWFLDQWDPGNPVYTLSLAIRLTGPLDLATLLRSLDRLAQRHATLRTTFADSEGQPELRVAARGALRPAVVDLSANPALAQPIARAVARTSFDLARGPLIRAALLRLGAGDHLLALALHRTIADARSLDLILADLAALYAAERDGAPDPAPAPQLQYADFAAWQRQALQGAVRDHQLDYWRDQLARAPTALELPTDRPRPPVRSARGARHAFALPEQAVAALDELCRQRGAIRFVGLLAAFVALLHRYTGQIDLLIGSPVAGRAPAEVAPIVGPFENMLALRADISGRPSFLDLLERVRATWQAAEARQDLPFGLLVEELRPERDPSRQPLFQTVFALRPALAPQRAGGLTLTPDAIDAGTSDFDLALEIEDPGARAALEYRTDLFDAATIARMAAHFATLLESAVAEPRRPVAILPMLPADEQRRLLVDWNASARPYPHEQGLQRLLEAQAERAPDAIAVCYEDRQLSYAALNARANQLARHLRGLGVGPDALVGLMVERSLEMIVGIVGVLKAGAAYVPIDPAYPPERIAYMIEDSRAHALVTKDEGRRTKDADAPLVVRPSSSVDLSDDWAAIAAQPAHNPPQEALGDQRAYVIYTSGSTGRPKGVMVRRRGLINLSYGLREFFDDPQVQHTGLFTSISFDISINQIFPTLLFGRTLHVVPDAIKLDSRAFLAFVRDRRIQVLDGVPSFYQNVLADVAPERYATDLRYLLIGGEKLETPLFEAIFAQLGVAVAVVNIYGLTEITDINAFGTIRAAEARDPVTVGRPLQNNRIYLVNRAGALQPIGVVGEICVAGESLSRGYLGRPDLTAEKFTPCPFEDGALMCHTGDLGRVRPDGLITVLGRMDHQVKVRGYRIELGEIEAALLQHPQVAEAAAALRHDDAGAPRLIAYVVTSDELGVTSSSASSGAGDTTKDERRKTNDGADPSSFVLRPSALAMELRDFLKSRLPGYMLPSAILSLDALPRTPNGKIDRNALPAPQGPLDADHEYVAPRTPIEAVLADMWRDSLQAPRVGAQDNFFDLGGHSLNATRIVSRVRQAFQVNMTVRHLFESPTVAALAERMIATEAQPGRTDKIARALQRLQGLSAADRQRILQRKQEREDS